MIQFIKMNKVHQVGPGMSKQKQQMVMQAFGVAAQGGFLAFSRDHETQADKIGLDLLVRACYDPREAPELWERMGEIGKGERPPPASCSNCMKTRFQISMKRSPSASGVPGGPPQMWSPWS